MNYYDELALYLRSARELSGISVEDFSNKTRIPKHTLLALEGAGNISLPPAIFVRGYINTYATEFNLPLEKTVEFYNKTLLKENELELERAIELKKISSNNLLSSNKKKRHSFSIIICLISTLIFISLLLFIFRAKDASFDQVKLINPTSSLVSIQEDKNTTLEQQSVIAELHEESRDEIKNFENTKFKSEEKIKSKNLRFGEEVNKNLIKLIISGNTWILAENRKKSIFRGLAKSGQVIILNGEPPFVLKLGMPDHVKFEKNGVITTYDEAKSVGMNGIIFL
jgi:cytoskeletal protein RodZ